jgi:DNA-binding sugar fermentation-stimulating protein
MSAQKKYTRNNYDPSETLKSVLVKTKGSRVCVFLVDYKVRQKKISRHIPNTSEKEKTEKKEKKVVVIVEENERKRRLNKSKEMSNKKSATAEEELRNLS